MFKRYNDIFYSYRLVVFLFRHLIDISISGNGFFTKKHPQYCEYFLTFIPIYILYRNLIHICRHDLYISYLTIMSLRLSLQVNISIQQKQRLMMSLEQSLCLEQSMVTLRSFSYPPEDSIAVIEKLLQGFLWTIKDSGLKESITNVFSDQDIKKMIVDQSVLLSFPSKRNFNRFVYKYLFHIMTQSQHLWEDILLDKQETLTSVDELTFIKAFENRSQLEEETSRIEDLIRSNSGNEFLVQEFKMKKMILNMVDGDLLQIAKNIAQIVEFFLMTKIKKESNCHSDVDLIHFLREKIILENMGDFSSERFLKRFLRDIPSFKSNTEYANRRSLKGSTINAIGEFMLISLGIISPEMFRLYNFSLSQDKIDALIKATNYTKEELKGIFNYYNLRGIKGEAIFYNRRFTQNQIPSRESDNLIKDFLMSTRQHNEPLLKGFWYEAFEKKIIEIKRDKTIDSQEKQDNIIEEINKRFWNDVFIKSMTQVLARYKYKDTYTLIQGK